LSLFEPTDHIFPSNGNKVRKCTHKRVC
jgi:hypothetical protein